MSEHSDERGPLIVEGQVWVRASDGRAAVRIGRAWRGAFTGVLDDYVRCHPVRGGHVWVTTASEFVKRYTAHSQAGQPSTEAALSATSEPVPPGGADV